MTPETFLRQIALGLICVACMFFDWHMAATLLACAQVGFSIRLWKTATDAQREKAKLIKAANVKIAEIEKKYEETTARLEKQQAELEKRRVELVEQQAEFAKCAPRRETVCALNDQVLLSCGHVVDVKGLPEPYRKAMAKETGCLACGEEAQKA